MCVWMHVHLAGSTHDHMYVCFVLYVCCFYACADVRIHVDLDACMSACMYAQNQTSNMSFKSHMLLRGSISESRVARFMHNTCRE